jgi:hypothetical protein
MTETKYQIEHVFFFFFFLVLGLRFSLASSVYAFGATQVLVLDWFYPRQFVIFARLFALPGTSAITFGFRDASAGMLTLNPAHVEATVAKLGECEGSCICKLMFDVRGFYNVRALFAPSQRRLTTAAQAFAVAMQANEAIGKDELLSWMQPQPTSSTTRQQLQQQQQQKQQQQP